MRDMYKNSKAVFLCLSGKSLWDAPLESLTQPGIVTCGVNNSPSIIRPNIWVGHDQSFKFLSSIWNDPTIMKFTKLNQRVVGLWDSEYDMPTLQLTDDCPNVHYYKPCSIFDPSSWCESNDVACTFEGRSSVFLSAIKVLVALGFPRIVLVGCDFKMDATNHYAFKQDRSKHWIDKNTELFKVLNKAMQVLQPNMKQYGVTVVNTLKDSGLTTVPYSDIHYEIEQALRYMPNPQQEKTDTMYDHNSVAEKFKHVLQKP